MCLRRGPCASPPAKKAEEGLLPQPPPPSVQVQNSAPPPRPPPAQGGTAGPLWGTSGVRICSLLPLGAALGSAQDEALPPEDAAGVWGLLGLSPAPPSPASSLLFSGFSQEFVKFATTEAIQRTEIFEYCQMLGRPGSFIPSFQVPEPGGGRAAVGSWISSLV